MPARKLRFVMAVAFLLFSGPASADMCRSSEAVTSFGTWFAPNLTLDARDRVRAVKHGLDPAEANSLRIRLAVAPDSKDRQWALIVRDSRLRTLATLGPVDFADSEGRLTLRRWTGRFPAADATIELDAVPTSDVVVSLTEGLAFPAESTSVRLFSIQGAKEKWDDLSKSGNDIPRREGAATGMLLTGTESAEGIGKASWCCTGVMVSSSLMLTNWHCGGNSGVPLTAYWNADVRDNMLVDLGWDDGTVRRQYSGVQLVAADRDLDFALIRVRPVVGAGSGGQSAAARISTRDPQANDPLFLIHHAQCKPKLLSEGCSVKAARRHAWTGEAPASGADDGPDFTHDCDTEPGASGAPVFAADGTLVGLHHAGFDRNEDCSRADSVNKAVRIGEIVKRLKEAAPEAAKELWFAE